jgi:hypothetical protein
MNGNCEPRNRLTLAASMLTTALVALACSGTSASDVHGATKGTASTSALPACSWPATLDGDRSSRDQCHASRRYLSCSNPDGSGELCTTDGGASCMGSAASCDDRCAANEYVAVCGGVGPGNVPDPPAGCKGMGAVPAGIAFYCCPCG